MPMNCGGLIEIVRQANLENITDVRFDCWTGNGSVESPGARASSGRELPIEFACGEIYLDDLATGCWLRLLKGAGVSRIQICDAPVGFVSVMLFWDVDVMTMIHDAMAGVISVFVLSMMLHRRCLSSVDAW